MTLSRNIRKLFAWRERSARAFEARMREENDYPTRSLGSNPKRKAREFERCYGSKARVLRIKSLPCCVPGCNEPAENAHTETGGMGRKAGWETVVDLCNGHHQSRSDSLHNLGSVARFKEVHGVDLKARAAVLAREIPA